MKFDSKIVDRQIAQHIAHQIWQIQPTFIRRDSHTLEYLQGKLDELKRQAKVKAEAKR